MLGHFYKGFCANWHREVTFIGLQTFENLRAARVQNEIAPEKLLNRYEKRFEKREKGSEKRSETRLKNF